MEEEQSKLPWREGPLHCMWLLVETRLDERTAPWHGSRRAHPKKASLT